MFSGEHEKGLPMSAALDVIIEVNYWGIFLLDG
jgi:hypothetical protein